MVKRLMPDNPEDFWSDCERREAREGWYAVVICVLAIVLILVVLYG